MPKPLFITTTIPYVTAPPHIGFALELVQTDVLARYHRLRGSHVRFQAGTDENAFKNVLSAKARGTSVQELVDENSGRFRSLAELLDISVDRFVRTTDAAHWHTVSGFLYLWIDALINYLSGLGYPDGASGSLPSFPRAAKPFWTVSRSR